MKIIKETKQSKNYNNKMVTYNYYYLVDEKNKLALPSGNDEIFESMIDMELGSYDFIFNEKFIFTWSRRSMEIELSPIFAHNPTAWIRDIKIDEILKDE